MANLAIGKTLLDGSNPPYILAELGLNHNGQLDLALKMVDAAKEAGCQGIKLQSFVAAEFVHSSQKALEIFKSCELSISDHEKIAAHCLELKIDFVSTPLSLGYVQILKDLGAKAIKIASGDMTFYDLIDHAFATDLPVIISTGMASLAEIDHLMQQKFINQDRLVLLHCISNYPPRLEDLHLHFMVTLADLYGIPTGFSDHSLGNVAAIGATALGARLIEKHFTLDKNLPGPDQLMSMNPSEMARLVHETREMHRALGQKRKPDLESEVFVRSIARRGLYPIAEIPSGTELSEKNAMYLRPPNSMRPEEVRLKSGRWSKGAGDWHRHNLNKAD